MGCRLRLLILVANRISVPYFWGWFLLCSSEDLMQPTGGCYGRCRQALEGFGVQKERDTKRKRKPKRETKRDQKIGKYIDRSREYKTPFSPQTYISATLPQLGDSPISRTLPGQSSRPSLAPSGLVCPAGVVARALPSPDTQRRYTQ